MKKQLQLLTERRIFLGISILIGISLIYISSDLTDKKANKSKDDFAKTMIGENDKDKGLSKELTPKIFEYILMMRTPIGAGDDYNIEGDRDIYEERQLALAKREQSLSRMTPVENQMFSRFESGKTTVLSNKKAGTASAVEWKSRGPGNVPGRTREVVVMPNDPTGNTWLIGTVGGGVWKTTDAGVTWENLTDDIPLLATSFLSVSASNPDVIYIGIGEPHAHAFNLLGLGVFKSMDGGSTWTRTPGSEYFGQVARMASDPNDENVVVVATNSGLRRTTDGGQTWANVSPFGTGTHFFQDLKVFEGDFNIQYTFNTTNNNSYKSTDGGATWTNQGRFPTIIGAHVRRAELAISRTNPERIYASVDADDISTDYEDEFKDQIAVSTDGGESWTYLTEQDEGLSDFLGGQGDYSNAIMVHPFNDNIVYVAGTQMYRYEIMELANSSSTLFSEATRIEVSTPADEFFGLGDGVGININVHVDHHNIKAIPGQGQSFRIISANDGGISLSDESENPGVEEDSWNNTKAFFPQEGVGIVFDAIRGVASSQFYAATKANGEDRYVGGMQDNGSYISPSGQNPNATTDYRAVSGGDGFTCLINYANPREILTTSQFNNILYSSDGGETVRNTNYRFRRWSPFLSWITNSNRFPSRVFSAHSGGVEVSEDFGQTWNLTPIQTPFWDRAGSNVRVAVNDYNPDVIIAATGAGTLRNGQQVPIQVSTDAGKTFEPKVIDINPGAAFFVSALNTSPTSDQVIYLGNSVRGAGVGKLFRSNDFGDSWEDLSGYSQGEDRGFPDAAVFDVIEMPYNDEIIWVSTDVGIVCSVNGGQSWTLLDTDLPAVAVWDMQIVNDQVVLATHGRGIWSVTIPELAEVDFDPINYLAEVEVYQPIVARHILIDYAFANNEPNYSVDVLVNGEVITTLDSDPRQGTYTFESDNTDSRVDTVSFRQSITVGHSQKHIRTELVKLLTYVDYLPAEYYYQNDFESGGDDFISFGNAQFTVSTPEGLDDNVLHNRHIPYLSNYDYISYIRKPVIVSTSTLFSFDNIAKVKAGKANNVFDYLVVEATKDGREWIDLVDPYDSDKSDLWIDDNNTPTEDLFQREELATISEFFDSGDTIAIRFKLHTYPSVNAWGWAIDNVEIGTNAKASIRLEKGDIQTIEGGALTFTATLESELSFPVTINEITITPGTANASDYNQEAITTPILTFEPGQSSKTFIIQTKDDSVIEGDEYFTVTLAEVNNATIDPSGVRATIIDNDSGISFFPNPLRDILNIRINKKYLGQVGVLIYNESGRIAYRGSFRKQRTIAQESIDLRYLTTGIYVVMISTPESVKKYKILKL